MPKSSTQPSSDDDDFATFKPTSAKKKPVKQSSFPFTSSEETVRITPSAVKSRKNNENVPPAQSTLKKKRGKTSSKRKGIKALLVSLSSEDESLPTVVPRSLKKTSTKANAKSRGQSSKELVPSAKTPEQNAISVISKATVSAKTSKLPPKQTTGKAIEQRKSSTHFYDPISKRSVHGLMMCDYYNDTIIRTPRLSARLSTNSTISNIDLPIAESTVLDVSTTDSYLSRPVFRQQQIVTTSESDEVAKLAEIPDEDLHLQLTLTQPKTQHVDRNSSSSMPTSEWEQRCELTQMPVVRQSTSDDEACCTVISETLSDTINSNPQTDSSTGPKVISESSLSLFSNKQDKSKTMKEKSDASSDQSISQNLSSYIKGKKVKGKKGKKKANLKFQLVTPDLSSDDEQVVNRSKLALMLEESRLMEDYGIPCSQTEGDVVFVPDSQNTVLSMHTTDIVPDSHDVYDNIHIKDTDSNSLRTVPDSEYAYVPNTQDNCRHIVKVVNDSEETVDVTEQCVVVVQDSEFVGDSQSSPSTQGQTVIHAPYQDTSSVDNATTMFIKSKTKYIGSTGKAKDNTVTAKDRAETLTDVKNSKGGVTLSQESSKFDTQKIVPISRTSSQNVSQLTASWQAKSNLHSVIHSLDDPDDLRAAIEMLSQRLEVVMSDNKVLAKSKQPDSRKTAIVTRRQGVSGGEKHGGSTKQRLSSGSFHLQHKNLSDLLDSSNESRPLQSSFNDLCINKIKSKHIDEGDKEEQYNIEASMQAPLADTEVKSLGHDSAVEIEEKKQVPEQRNVSTQASINSTNDFTEDLSANFTEDLSENFTEDLSDDYSEDLTNGVTDGLGNYVDNDTTHVLMQSISLQCSLQSEASENCDTSILDKHGKSDGCFEVNDELVEDEAVHNSSHDKDAKASEDDSEVLSPAYEDDVKANEDDGEEHDILYQTAMGEDLNTMLEYLTDDESFDKSPLRQSPNESLMVRNVLSRERVKRILSKDRRSSIRFMPLRIPAGDELSSNRVKNQNLPSVDDEKEDTEESDSGQEFLDLHNESVKNSKVTRKHSKSVRQKAQAQSESDSNGEERDESYERPGDDTDKESDYVSENNSADESPMNARKQGRILTWKTARETYVYVIVRI